MAYDIGPRIGIDGEAEFRKSIQNINANIKALGSEMKLVTATYEDNADSMEALSAKSDVLERSLAQQEKHLEETSKMLERAAEKYGESSTEALKWQRAVNESKTALQRTSKELEKMNSEMERLIEEAKDAENDVEKLGDEFDDLIKDLDKIADEAENADDAFEELGDEADKAGDKLSAMKVATGNLIADGVGVLADDIKDAASWMINLDDATEDYRINQGKLEAAYKASGKSVELAEAAYKSLYRVIGDTDQATEAAQLMADLAESEEDVGKWADIAAGTVTKFGDSLPVENLIETAQEAVKTGEAVSGGLADALMWSGVNVEEFNEKLAACTTAEERNRLVTETLTGIMGPYADSFYETNEAVLAARDSQLLMDEATGRLGEAVGKVKDGLVQEFGPTLADAANWAADFIEGIDTEELKRKFDDAWTFIANGARTVKGWLDQVGDAAENVLQDWGFGSRGGGFGSGNGGVVGGEGRGNDIPSISEKGAGNVYIDGKLVGNIVTDHQHNNDLAYGVSRKW